MKSLALAVIAAAALTVGMAGCTPAPTVATFEVAGVQTYRIQLVTQDQIDHVKALLAGSEEGRIPNGKVVRDDPSVNSPWSWHIDPNTLEFADQTIEVCDGLPEYVEDHTVTSDYYCPWSARVIKLEGPGAK